MAIDKSYLNGKLIPTTKYYRELSEYNSGVSSAKIEYSARDIAKAYLEEIKNSDDFLGLEAESSLYYSVFDKIKEIHLCLILGLYVAALSMALTIPDTCGLIEDVTRGSNVYDRYTAWFDKYVYERGISDYKSLGFNGCACYQLRNRILHNNNTAAVNEKLVKERKYEFSLCVHSELLEVYSDSLKGANKIEIGIPILCDDIVDGFLNFIAPDYPAPIDYRKYAIEFKNK